MPDAETVGKIRYTLSAEQNTRVPSCGGISRMAIYIRLARNAGKGKGGGRYPAARITVNMMRSKGSTALSFLGPMGAPTLGSTVGGAPSISSRLPEPGL